MFYLRFLKKNSKKWANPSFSLFWWAMWVNRSFCSNQMSDVSKLLISLTKNEWPWAIGSGCSEEMSDVSESLIFGQKTSNLLGNQMSEVPALHFATTTHCNFKFWKIDPPYCTAHFFSQFFLSVLPFLFSKWLVFLWSHKRFYKQFVTFHQFLKKYLC